MVTALQIGNRTITTDQIIPLLATYQMLPLLMRESIIDLAIAPINCTAEETASACQQFYQQNSLTSEAQRQAWLKRYGMSQTDLEVLATRKLRIEKFKQQTWGQKLGTYFLKRKPQMDLAVYSLIRTKDAGLAQELYFRIQQGEQSFVELAREYSQGPEAQTGGIIGPVELGTLEPKLARLLSVSQPGQILPPRFVGEWLLIVRLEKFIPAQLNELMHKRLLRELFEAWLQEQMSQVSRSA